MITRLATEEYAAGYDAPSPGLSLEDERTVNIDSLCYSGNQFVGQLNSYALAL